VTNSGKRAKPRKPRVPLWDNSRLILIFLVVIGHTLTTVRTTATLPYGLYVFMYLFHMPGMILISGVFSKVNVTRRSLRGIAQLMVIWVIWEFLWIFIRMGLGRNPVPESFLAKSSWSLWFLFSLATMRMLLPFIARFRFPITLSVAVAIIAGLNPALGTEFSASRTLTFLPFFVIGWSLRNRGWFSSEWFLHPSARLKTAAAAFMALILGLVSIPGLRDFWRVDRWLTWDNDYETLLKRAEVGGAGDPIHIAPDGTPLDMFTNLGIVTLILGVSAALVGCVLILAPRKQYWFTPWGQRTLYVYLLHGPIIQVMRTTGFVDAIGDWGTMGIITLIAIGFVIATLLSTKPFMVVFKPVIEPPIEWLMGLSPNKTKVA
jgi:fucose 4-O-acetylase-like acetyltransferase